MRRISVNDILGDEDEHIPGGLPDDATGVRWEDTQGTECRDCLLSWSWAEQAGRSDAKAGIILTGPVECDACAGITYDPIGASMLPAGGKIIWVTPRRCQGQIVEVSYSRGIPAGKGINYEADAGDPYMRVIDHSDGHVAYYVRRGSRRQMAARLRGR
jgi:hypothetical protein